MQKHVIAGTKTYKPSKFAHCCNCNPVGYTYDIKQNGLSRLLHKNISKLNSVRRQYKPAHCHWF